MRLHDPGRASLPASHRAIRLGRTSDFDELSRVASSVEPSLALPKSCKAV